MGWVVTGRSHSVLTRLTVLSTDSTCLRQAGETNSPLTYSQEAVPVVRDWMSLYLAARLRRTTNSPFRDGPYQLPCFVSCLIIVIVALENLLMQLTCTVFGNNVSVFDIIA